MERFWIGPSHIADSCFRQLNHLGLAKWVDLRSPPSSYLVIYDDPKNIYFRKDSCHATLLSLNMVKGGSRSIHVARFMSLEGDSLSDLRDTGKSQVEIPCPELPRLSALERVVCATLQSLRPDLFKVYNYLENVSMRFGAPVDSRFATEILFPSVTELYELHSQLTTTIRDEVESKKFTDEVETSKLHEVTSFFKAQNDHLASKYMKIITRLAQNTRESLGDSPA